MQVERNMAGFRTYQRPVFQAKRSAEGDGWSSLLQAAGQSRAAHAHEDDGCHKEKISGSSPRDTSYGINIPESVQEAWNKAEKEVGINGTAREAGGKLSRLTTLFVMSLEMYYTEGTKDVLGSTEASARAAVRKALERLKIPQTEAENKEKMFYEAFLRYL